MREFTYERFRFLAIMILLLMSAIAILSTVYGVRSDMVITLFLLVYIIFYLYAVNYIFKYFINKKPFMFITEKSIIIYQPFRKITIKWSSVTNVTSDIKPAIFHSGHRLIIDRNKRRQIRISLYPFKNPNEVITQITQLYHQINDAQGLQQIRSERVALRNKRFLVNIIRTSIIAIIVLIPLLIGYSNSLSYAINRTNNLHSVTMTSSGMTGYIEGNQMNLILNGVTYYCDYDPDQDDVDCTSTSGEPIYFTSKQMYYHNKFDWTNLTSDYKCTKNGDSYKCSARVVMPGHPDRITVRVVNKYVKSLSIHYMNDSETYTFYFSKYNDTDVVRP